MKRIIIAGISLAAVSAIAIAQDHTKMDHSKMQGMEMKDMKEKGGMASTGMELKGDQGPSSKAFNDINIKMHSDMAITYSGDADVDFMKGMMAHHQGAIDMAKVVLKYGKDPETKKLAEAIIKAQEGEIVFMTDWIAKKAK
jgi:uncharacterized protein (DUF305 family)